MLTLIVLTIRAKSVYVVGDFFGASGGETLAAYAIWKVQHGLKLYEWSFRAPFALTIYNYLFYFTYATAASVLHWDGGSLLRFGRYLTLLFALIGAAAQWQLTLLLVPKQTRRIRLLLPMLAFVTWLGSSLVSWWVLTIRADIAASALVMFALLTFFYGSIKRIAWTPVLTACVFFLAWSLKQTFVFSLAGLLLFLLYTRRYKSVLQISATLGVLCTICLIVGGPEYRYNILVAPPLVHTYFLANAVRYLLQSVVPNLFIFGFPVYYLLSRPASKPLNPTPKNVSATNWTLPFWFMFWTSLTLSFLTSTKEGATTNYYLEWYFAASVLAGLLCAEVISDGSQQTRHQIAAAVLRLTSLIYPAIQVLAFTLKINTPWHLALGSRQEYESRQSFARYLNTLPKPVFTSLDVFKYPWFATNNSYPAIILEPVWYKEAERRGILEEKSVAGLFAKHCFSAVIVEAGEEFFQQALRAGYRQSSDILVGQIHYLVLARPSSANPAAAKACTLQPTL